VGSLSVREGLDGLELLVDQLDVCPIHVYGLHYRLEVVQLVPQVLRFEVQNESERDELKHVHVDFFAVRLQIEEEEVLGGKMLMALDVVDELFVAVLAEDVELEALGNWLPLEIKEVIIVARLLPKQLLRLILEAPLILVESVLDYPLYYKVIVSLSDDVLEGLAPLDLAQVGRDLGVLLVGLLPLLEHLLLLLHVLIVGIRVFFQRSLVHATRNVVLLSTLRLGASIFFSVGDFLCVSFPLLIFHNLAQIFSFIS